MSRHEQENNGRDTERQATKEKLDSRQQRQGTGPHGGDSPRGGSHEQQKAELERGQKAFD